MKKPSWGCCVLVFDSSGDPALPPEGSDFCAPGCSGTQFEVGRTTSCEKRVGATVSAPMDYESSRNCFKFWINRVLGRFSSLLSSRSSTSPSMCFWREGRFHRGWNEETKEIAECQSTSSFSASSAKCISLKRLSGLRPQSNVSGAGFRRWYVSFCMRIFLVALHASSSIPLFCFRPLFRRSCYHAHQCDMSPAGQSFSFGLCWGTRTISWHHCDELVLLVFIVI